MKVIEGDLTTLISGVIVHQINDSCIFKSGIALGIARRWPQVVEKCKTSTLPLSKLVLVMAEENIYIANIVGQDLQHGTYHWALCKGLEQLANVIDEVTPLPMYIPIGIGSNRGGGSRELILLMVETFLPNATLVEYVKDKQIKE